MAPRNQGIMTVDPTLVERLIGTKPPTRGLGELIGANTGALTRDEFFGKGGPMTLGVGGTKFDEIKRDIATPVKLIYDTISNIPGAAKGIGEFFGQESDAAKKRRAVQAAGQMSGFEFGQPDMGKIAGISGMDIFTGAGQDKLAEEAKQAIQNTIRQNQPDAAAFDPGTTDISQADIDKAQEQSKKFEGPGEEVDIADEEFANFADADALKSVDTPAKKAVVSSLNDIMKEVRPGIKAKDYDDYIKEFGEATGLDISGEPDTKQALMSFGLALMQNRAGKGFNISNILGSVGEAGEAAMPEFSKAVSEAKAIRAKAGAFAISRKKEDEAAARNRKNYVIVPKGKGGIKGLAANMDKAQNLQLNSFELNALMENKKFQDSYEVVPDSQYNKVLEAALKTPELGKKYLTSKGTLPLFEGAEGVFDVPVQYPDRNYLGKDAATKPAFLGDKDAIEQAFRSMRKDIDRGKAEFRDLVAAIEAPGGVTVWKQGVDALTNLGAAFGVDFKDEQTSTGKIKLILNRIQAKYAPQILGETGKTISDADRARVAKIVGELKAFQNPAELKAAIERIFGDIIGQQERKLKQGVINYNSLTNQQVKLDFGGGLSETQQKELAAYEQKFKAQGT